MSGLYKIEKPDNNSVMTFSILSETPTSRLNEDTNNGINELIKNDNRLTANRNFRAGFGKGRDECKLNHLTIEVDTVEATSGYFKIQENLSPISLPDKLRCLMDETDKDLSDTMPGCYKGINGNGEFCLKGEIQDFDEICGMEADKDEEGAEVSSLTNNNVETKSTPSLVEEVNESVERNKQVPVCINTPDQHENLKLEQRSTPGFYLSPKSINKFAKLTIESTLEESPHKINNNVVVETDSYLKEVEYYNMNKISDRIKFSSMNTGPVGGWPNARTHEPGNILKREVFQARSGIKNEALNSLAGLRKESNETYDIPMETEKGNVGTLRFKGLKDKSQFIESFFNIKKDSPPVRISPESEKKGDGNHHTSYRGVNILEINLPHENFEKRSSVNSADSHNAKRTGGKNMMMVGELVESEIIVETSLGSKRPTVSTKKPRPTLTLDISQDNDNSDSIKAVDSDGKGSSNAEIKNSISSRNKFLKDSQMEDLRVAKEKRSELVALKEELLQFSIVNGILAAEKEEFYEAIALIDKEIGEINVIIERLSRGGGIGPICLKDTDELLEEKLDELIDTERLEMTDRSSFYVSKQDSINDKRIGWNNRIRENGANNDRCIPSLKLRNISRQQITSREFTKNAGHHPKNIPQSKDKYSPPGRERSNQSNQIVKTSKKVLSSKEPAKHTTLNQSLKKKPNEYAPKRQTIDSQKSLKPVMNVDIKKRTPKRVDSKCSLTSKNLKNSVSSKTKPDNSIKKGSLGCTIMSRAIWDLNRKSPSRLFKNQVEDEYFGAHASKKPVKFFENLKHMSNTKYKQSVERHSQKSQKHINSLSRVSDDDAECTFTPRSYSKRMNVTGTFNERLSAWSVKKREKIESERMLKSKEQIEQMQTFFMPKINDRSRELMKNVGTSFEQRCSVQNYKAGYVTAMNNITVRKKEGKIYMWTKEVLEIKSLFKITTKL